MAEKININYLIPDLRISIGDTNSASFRYTDEWLTTALLGSIKALGGYWNMKYLVETTTNLIYRNPNVFFYSYDAEPPVIIQKDERPVILMASIIVLEGSLENSAWNLASWKDNEVSFTNLESGRIKDRNLQRLIDELNSIITPPTKKLGWAIKNSLPGFKNNEYERSDEF
jgi:hypothetical protein